MKVTIEIYADSDGGVLAAVLDACRAAASAPPVVIPPVEDAAVVPPPPVEDLTGVTNYHTGASSAVVPPPPPVEVECHLQTIGSARICLVVMCIRACSTELAFH